MEYYVDSCVWLNIFNKNEEHTKAAKTSKELIKKILFSKRDEIIYSGFVLRELEYKLKENYGQKKKWFIKEPKVVFIKANENIYEEARKIEKENSYKISFFDCLQIALNKETKSILVTRDKELLLIGKKYTEVMTPEEALKRVNLF